MAEALSLVIGGLNHEHALIFAAGSTLLQVFVPYRRYSPVLKFLTLTLFAYVATAFTVKIPWGTALLAAVWPKATISADYFLMVVAVLGTTISPYLFFWQASQEVEEMNQGKRDKPLRDLPSGGAPEIARIKADTIVGMLLSNSIAFFIILTTAAVLNGNGVTRINSATEAAEALRPLAGDFTFALFALGIIGTGLRQQSHGAVLPCPRPGRAPYEQRICNDKRGHIWPPIWFSDLQLSGCFCFQRCSLPCCG